MRRGPSGKQTGYNYLTDNSIDMWKVIERSTPREDLIRIENEKADI
jgi:hypothetical protein